MLMRGVNLLPSEKFGAITAKINASYVNNQSIWTQFWTQSSIDSRLEAGDLSLLPELGSLLPKNVNYGLQFFFNQTRTFVNSIDGHQRRYRKSSVVVPDNNNPETQKTADQWTKILMNIYKKNNIYETISTAFRQGACLSGLNLLHVYIDYTRDPISGDIKVENLPYNTFFIDPYFKQFDLSDASFIWKRSYLPPSAVAALMPDDLYEEIINLPSNSMGIGRNNRFQFMPQSSGQTLGNLFAYDEYYYRDYREQKILIDRKLGITREILPGEDLDLDFLLAIYPQLRVEKQTIPTVRLAIMIQDRVFYDGPSGMDNYPFIPVMGYYNPAMPFMYDRIQSVCRSLRDPQLLLNRRIILNSDLLESTVNSGFVYKEDGLVDPESLFQTGQGRTIAVKSDYQIGEVLQPIQPPQIPPSMMELAKSFSDLMSLVSGVSEANLGMQINSAQSNSGFQESLRQSAGITTLQVLFDQLDSSQNLLGERIMELIRSNYTSGKIEQMLGEKPSEEFYNKLFSKYHCAVELGYNTQTQKQLQFAQLLELRNIGVSISDKALIEAATIQNKNDLIKEMEEQQKSQQQLQQQQAEIQMEELRSRAELSRARAQADIGLGIERISRVQENEALAIERKAEALKDDNAALLNYVKAMKEIENIDLDQLQKIIALKQMLEDKQERKNTEEAKGIDLLTLASQAQFQQ